MSDTSITPNMNLVVPTVGEDPGPDWANNINADLGILDQHNHSAGQGVQITPSGLNINSDLPLNGNNLTLVNTTRFNNLLTSLAGITPNLGVVYEAVNELYFNDGVGNVVQITKAGSVNATTSGISSGTATASFVGGTLVVDANVNTPANVQGASFLFGNNVSGSNYLTLEPPNAMASNYTVTLPPINSSGSTAFMTYDTSNNMGVGPAVTGGITAANIAPQSITQALLAPKTLANPAPVGGIGQSSVITTSIASTSPVLIGGTVTITTTGRPVLMYLSGPTAGSFTFSEIYITNGTTDNCTGIIYLYNMTLGIYTGIHVGMIVTPYSGPNVAFIPVNGISWVDISVNGLPGTYTYQLLAQLNNGSEGMIFTNVYTNVYEI
jgi:hypothetical protein